MQLANGTSGTERSDDGQFFTGAPVEKTFPTSIAGWGFPSLARGDIFDPDFGIEFVIQNCDNKFLAGVITLRQQEPM